MTSTNLHPIFVRTTGPLDVQVRFYIEFPTPINGELGGIRRNTSKPCAPWSIDVQHLGKWTMSWNLSSKREGINNSVVPSESQDFTSMGLRGSSFMGIGWHRWCCRYCIGMYWHSHLLGSSYSIMLSVNRIWKPTMEIMSALFLHYPWGTREHPG